MIKYRAEIDGLRALAVIPVILFHAGISSFSGGFVGVDIFFVISGYLITSIILAEKTQGQFTLARFYERRARRIFPALFFVIICTLPFAWMWMIPSQMLDYGQAIIAVITFVSNILFWQQSGYFSPDAELNPLLHTWSLAVEEQFYLVFPIFLIIFWSFGKRFLISVIVVASLFSLALAQFGGNIDIVNWGLEEKLFFTSTPSFGFFLIVTRAWELMAGALVAFYLFFNPESKGCSLLAGAGVLMLLFAIFMFDDSTPFPSIYTIIPVLGTVLVILFGTANTRVAALLSMRPLVGIGLISYSAYLWHQPLFAFAKLRFSPDVVTFLFLSFLSIILAWGSWRWVEQPFRNKSLISAKKLWFMSATVATALICIASSIIIFNGFVNRYSKEDQYLANLDFNAASEYVIANFNKTQLKPFADDKRKKVIIIGDSYAQDLMNALVENGAEQSFALSTYFLRAGCGNLYTEEDIIPLIAASSRTECQKIKRYSNKVLQARLKEAEVILLASAWQEWEVKRLQKSIERLKLFNNAKIFVLGKKSFNKVNVHQLFSMNKQQKLALTHTLDGKNKLVNEALESTLAEEHLIHFQETVCGSKYTCPIFTPELRLISYDGGHLTQDGAVFVGQKLMEHPSFRELLE